MTSDVAILVGAAVFGAACYGAGYSKGVARELDRQLDRSADRLQDEIERLRERHDVRDVAVWCAKCGDRRVDPAGCDLSPPVCKPCRYEMSNGVQEGVEP